MRTVHNEFTTKSHEFMVHHEGMAGVDLLSSRYEG